jgi:GDPmannose 4,6-dehydratase
MKRALICGVTGQDGAYLSDLLLKKNYEVFGTSRDAQTASFENLLRLEILERVTTVSMVPTNFRSVLEVITQIEPDEIYNLSGQSSVGLSFQQPVETLDSITVGTLNLLEVIRFTGQPIRFYNAGSGECFGDTGGLAVDENHAFRPCSPYATAKAAAYWTVANYREAYALYACTGILFNHESPLRPRHFVTRKVVHAACAIARGEGLRLELGNLGIRRDWGWAPEYVDAMWRMLQQDVAQDFVIATGASYSLRNFCDTAFEAVGLCFDDHVTTNEELLRPLDIAANCGNASKAHEVIGWRAKSSIFDVVRRMIEAESERKP